MSTKTIPAQTIKTCDCCQVVIGAQNSRKEGCLTLKANALDMQGAPCADATRKLDLCDSCLYDVAPRRPPKVLHLWPPKLLHPAWGDLMH